MDFFEHQERARRNTFLLTLIFFLAVILIIFAIYALFVFVFSLQPGQISSGLKAGPVKIWNPVLFLWTTIGALAVITSGTFYKMALLSSGGAAVARIFGAKLINPQTINPAERRLLNVVEEMAIAAGIPVPQVYVLEEECINAFAAGLSTRDAIIGVTSGGMNRLSRDELQAVIAHEYSHIFNGDMRLNLRLMGVLHGILVISLIGWWIFRISSQSSRPGAAGPARRKGGNTLLILLTGLCLMIIGYIGVFFARLIKSAVSRQREFLADAASVQFTRNPEGMVGALKKIGGLIQGSSLTHPSAEEASHFFFADGLKHSFFNIMATHPPLVERIRRIDPAFNGTFPPLPAAMPSIEENGGTANLAARSAASYEPSARQTASFDPGRATDLVGQLDPQRLGYINRWLAALPPPIRIAAHAPLTAQALIMAMLVSRNEQIRNNQLSLLENSVSREIYQSTIELIPVVQDIPREWLLPITEMALATLKTLSLADLNAFNVQIRNMAEADKTITLFEYMLLCIIKNQIKSSGRREKEGFFGSSDLPRYLPAMDVILSTLAYYGNNEDAGAIAAFSAGVKQLAVRENIKIFPHQECGLQQTDKALARLESASMQIKKSFLNACSVCITHDKEISPGEGELFRAIAAVLGCPVPPFLFNDQ